MRPATSGAASISAGAGRDAAQGGALFPFTPKLFGQDGRDC